MLLDSSPCPTPPPSVLSRYFHLHSMVLSSTDPLPYCAQQDREFIYALENDAIKVVVLSTTTCVPYVH